MTFSFNLRCNNKTRKFHKKEICFLSFFSQKSTIDGNCKMSKKSPALIKGMKIIDLNKDCLINIFKYLSYTDLYNLNGIHAAFNAAVDHVARTVSFELSITKFDSIGWKEMKHIDNFVKTFGDRISHLKIRIARDSSVCSKLMHTHLELLIEQYCCNGNVRFCSFIDRFVLTKEFLQRNKKIFKSLQSLRIDYLMENDNLLWLMDFVVSNEIKKFQLCGGHLSITTQVLKKIASSKLETCILRVLSKDKISDQISNLPINRNLKHLNLFGVSFNPAHLIHFPNLETLEFFKYKKHPLDPILELPQLKKLHLIYQNNRFLEIAPFLMKLAKQNKLESFNLDNDYYDEEEDERRQEHEDRQERYNDFLAYANFISTDDDLRAYYEDFEYDFSEYDQDDDGDDDIDDRKATSHLMANIICKMPNLNELTLYTICALKEHLPRIGKKLNKLQRLHVQPFDDRDVNKRKQAVEKLKILIKEAKNLNYFYFECEEVDIAKLYADLVKIRKSQKNKKVLLIHFPYYGYDDDKIHTTTNQEKYVKVTYGV